MALSVATEVQTPPQIFFDDVPTPEKESEKIEHRQRVWNRLREWAKRENKQQCMDTAQNKLDTPPPTPTRPGVGRRFSRKVGVGIPRSTTFRRQEEEQRKNLEPVVPCSKERRDVSKVRQRALSAQPVPPRSLRRQGSAPEVGYHKDAFPSIAARMVEDSSQQPLQPRLNQSTQEQVPSLPPPPPPRLAGDTSAQNTEAALTEASYDDVVDEEIRDELERKWILNLSMHFRDKSPREKFFLTYAETPQKWRRVTISVDYRDAPPDSLEADLQVLTSQRDKSARVYESIRMSLPDIQFYDTVTNLKLKTEDDRLHVHVTEDVNEIIAYPSSRAVQHLQVKHYRESELHFVEHMSGFVYKVDVGKHVWIKKEIPGPDSVEEFLYEINALSDLVDSKNVIELKGLVVNDEHTLVKGLLIGYADSGALVDVIYDNRGQIPWQRRERWAKQIVRGLSEIHEAGFVQGDFTLSNIVIDGKDKAKIIDINRRGCPVGWEPPEIGRLIENGQRISMFIGVKSDLFQLGMVLWALAMEEDEPERQMRPLIDHPLPDDTPSYYRELLAICLSQNPAQRQSGKDLLQCFPPIQQEDSPPTFLELTGLNDGVRTTGIRTDSIDELDFGESANSDFAEARKVELNALGLKLEAGPHTEIDLDEHGLIPQNSINFSPFEELSSNPMDRGRRPPSTMRHLSMDSDYISPGASGGVTPNVIPVSPTGDRKWAEITLDGTPYLVQRDTLESLDEEDFNSNKAEETPLKGRRAPSRNLTGFGGEFEHVDSGIADMDIGPQTAPRSSLEKVDEHETVSDDLTSLKTTQKVTSEDKGTQAAKGHTDDLGTEHYDRNVDMGL